MYLVLSAGISVYGVNVAVTIFSFVPLVAVPLNFFSVATFSNVVSPEIVPCKKYAPTDADEEFVTLKYSFTSKLDYKLSNYKGTDPENGLKASMKQIEYIYLLLQEKNMPLLLKDHRNLSKKDASEIIRKLKANNLLYDDKNKFFIEKK